MPTHTQVRLLTLSLLLALASACLGCGASSEALKVDDVLSLEHAGVGFEAERLEVIKAETEATVNVLSLDITTRVGVVVLLDVDPPELCVTLSAQVARYRLGWLLYGVDPRCSQINFTAPIVDTEAVPLSSQTDLKESGP